MGGSTKNGGRRRTPNPASREPGPPCPPAGYSSAGHRCQGPRAAWRGGQSFVGCSCGFKSTLRASRGTCSTRVICALLSCWRVLVCRLLVWIQIHTTGVALEDWDAAAHRMGKLRTRWTSCRSLLSTFSPLLSRPQAARIARINQRVCLWFVAVTSGVRFCLD